MGGWVEGGWPLDRKGRLRSRGRETFFFFAFPGVKVVGHR